MLKIKKEHAQVMFRFLRARKAVRKGKINGPYGADEIQAYERLAQMNRR